MTFDLVLRGARIAGQEAEAVDIGVTAGRFAAIAPALAADGPEQRLDGRLVIPGFVDSHIHLDKSCILGRCQCRS